jgi:hypothetical protein
VKLRRAPARPCRVHTVRIDMRRGSTHREGTRNTACMTSTTEPEVRALRAIVHNLSLFYHLEGTRAHLPNLVYPRLLS